MALRTHASAGIEAGDQFYLCAHDFKGRPRLTPRAIELGAASAVTGELVFRGFLVIVDDRVQLRGPAWELLQKVSSLRRTTAVRWMLEEIAAAPAIVVRDWITRIAPLAPEWIARRLEASGQVRKVVPPWFMFWQPAPRYVPLDINEPHKLGDHLGLALYGKSSLSVTDVFLAGLLQATQLHRTCIAGLTDLDEVIDRQVRVLTKSAHSQTRDRDASLSALLLRTRQLVDTAALAQTL